VPEEMYQTLLTNKKPGKKQLSTRQPSFAFTRRNIGIYFNGKSEEPLEKEPAASPKYA
jgi:hypothetical protein